MRKHICFVNSAFTREDALIVYRQGKSLVEAGFRVSYTVRDGKPNEIKEGIEIICLDTKPKSTKERLKTNGNVFKTFLKSFEADVYQINEPELLHLGLWLKRQGKFVVFNLREWYPDYYARKTAKPVMQKLIHYVCEKYFNYVAQKYDAVFNCMPEMHDYIEKVMPCKYFYDTPNFPVGNKDFIYIAVCGIITGSSGDGGGQLHGGCGVIGIHSVEAKDLVDHAAFVDVLLEIGDGDLLGSPVNLNGVWGVGSRANLITLFCLGGVV